MPVVYKAAAGNINACAWSLTITFSNQSCVVHQSGVERGYRVFSAFANNAAFNRAWIALGYRPAAFASGHL